MPLTKKGKKILASMKKQYGEEKGERVFYASRNKGRIKGIEKGKKLHNPDSPYNSQKEIASGSTPAYHASGKLGKLS